MTSSGEGDGEGLGYVLGFMRSLWALDHALRRASKEMKRRIGLTGPQRLALRVVEQFPQSTAGEIARVLHVHPSTLTGVLDRLGSSGLLRRKTDSNDRRRARFELTAMGERAVRARAGTVEERVRRALQGVPADDIRVARGVLKHLAEEFTNERSRR